MGASHEVRVSRLKGGWPGCGPGCWYGAWYGGGGAVLVWPGLVLGLVLGHRISLVWSSSGDSAGCSVGWSVWSSTGWSTGGVDRRRSYGCSLRFLRLRALARLVASPITPAAIRIAGAMHGEIVLVDHVTDHEGPDDGHTEEEQAEDEMGDLDASVGGRLLVEI